MFKVMQRVIVEGIEISEVELRELFKKPEVQELIRESCEVYLEGREARMKMMEEAKVDLFIATGGVIVAAIFMAVGIITQAWIYSLLGLALGGMSLLHFRVAQEHSE